MQTVTPATRIDMPQNGSPTMLTVIVDNDTLRAIGLSRLLEERHGLHTVITADPTQLEGITEHTLFFVTPEAFAAKPYFYVPRRRNVVLISRHGPSPLPVLNPEASHAELATFIDNTVRNLGAVPPPTTLSVREADILRLVARGLTNKEIAAELAISFNTVLTHRKNITAKLGIKSISAQTIYAVMNGLVLPDETRLND